MLSTFVFQSENRDTVSKSNTLQQQQESLALNNMLRNSVELLNKSGKSIGEE